MSMISKQVEFLRKAGYALMQGDYNRKLFLEAADTIEALSAKLEEANMERSDRYYSGGWIACEDRLPEEDINVLIQVSGKFKNVTFEDSFELGTYIKGEGWFIESYPDWENPNVIAWQSLPKEPYHPQPQRS